MTIEEYHSDRTIVSSTGLKAAKNSTRDFIWYVIHGTEQKLYFDFGNAFELYLMDQVNGTNEYEESVAVEPTQDWIAQIKHERPDVKAPKLTKQYQEWLSEFREKATGKYIIPDVGRESHEWVLHMTQSCLANETIAKLLSGTTYQQSLFWTDPETGVKCKTRPDVCMIKKNVILDIKTTMDASPEAFTRQACNLNYPIQAVMQAQGCIESDLMPAVDNYFWLAVEKKEPFNVGLYELQQDDLEYFIEEYKFLLKRCAKGLAEIATYKEPSDIYNFASYGEQAHNKHGILQMEIPAWYRNGFL